MTDEDSPSRVIAETMLGDLDIRHLSTNTLKESLTEVLQELHERGELEISFDTALDGIPNYGAEHPTYWGAALAGEAGELANITKKWERDGIKKTSTGLFNKEKKVEQLRILQILADWGYTNDTPEDKMHWDILKVFLGGELADVMIYGKIMADAWEIDLARAIQSKKEANAEKRRVG